MERQAPAEVVGAIKKASARTGVDFAYLMEKASAESSFRTDIKAKTSSATGLFQFIEKTWIAMVRDHGDEYGLGEYAEKISASGKVTDAKTRKEILELRKDPETAAAMAAEYAADNKEFLEDRTRSDIGPVELYLAHFMGPSGAAGFINAMDRKPLDTAADIFPEAARANRNVFYDAKTGKPRTLAGVYDFFAKKFENSTDGVKSSSDIMLASASYEPRMAGSKSVARTQPLPVKSTSYANDILWAQELFRDTQARHIRLLAGTQDDEDNNLRSDKLATLSKRAGHRQAMIASPLQIMELAQLDTHAIKSRYNQ